MPRSLVIACSRKRVAPTGRTVISNRPTQCIFSIWRAARSFKQRGDWQVRVDGTRNARLRQPPTASRGPPVAWSRDGLRAAGTPIERGSKTDSYFMQQRRERIRHVAHGSLRQRRVGGDRGKLRRFEDPGDKRCTGGKSCPFGQQEPVRRPAKMTATVLSVADAPCSSIQDGTCRRGCRGQPSRHR